MPRQSLFKTPAPAGPGPQGPASSAQAPTPAPAAAGTEPPQVQIPRSIQDVANLRSEREQLSSQLNASSSQRNALSRQLRTVVDNTDRTGLQDRIRLLDQRILQIESDMSQTGRLLSMTPDRYMHGGTLFQNGRMGMPPDQGFSTAPLFMLFVLAPLAIVYARRLWMRSTSRASTNANPLPGVETRLERMEEALETIAVEIERVSEGQRFITRVMSGAQPSVGAAGAPAAGVVPGARASQPPVASAVGEPRSSGAPAVGESHAAAPTNGAPPAFRALGPGEAPFVPVEVRDRESVRARD